ncbi:hypothetical protein GGR56DRAFT_23451 [Xylariaceae sp. FL0804]|nr:hypothetical protein GGR56DRAFT_23451 [Xylariaceae sp. FL0804]
MRERLRDALARRAARIVGTYLSVCLWLSRPFSALPGLAANCRDHQTYLNLGCSFFRSHLFTSRLRPCVPRVCIYTWSQTRDTANGNPEEAPPPPLFPFPLPLLCPLPVPPPTTHPAI